MARPPSKTPLLIGIIGFALLCLVGLNVMQQAAAPKTEAQLEAEEKKKAEAAEAKNAPQTPQAPPGATSGGDQLVALGADAMLGPVKATQEVTIGWEWTPEVQGDPGKLYQVIEQISKSAPNVRVRVVNRDADPNVPLGLSNKGRVLLPLQPDGMLPVEAPRAMQPFIAPGPPGTDAAP